MVTILVITNRYFFLTELRSLNFVVRTLQKENSLKEISIKGESVELTVHTAALLYKNYVSTIYCYYMSIPETNLKS